MKKVIGLILVFLLTAILVGCQKEETPNQYFRVTFIYNNGDYDKDVYVNPNTILEAPVNPNKVNHIFDYWLDKNKNTKYDFSLPVLSDLTLTAIYKEIADPDYQKENRQKINKDILEITKSIYLNKEKLNIVDKGPIHGSLITWESKSKYISKEGIILPKLESDTTTKGIVTATFNLNGTVLKHDFEVNLDYDTEVLITNSRKVNFRNLTSEYHVDDSSINLYYEQNGTVPYVKIKDFLNLLEGFIDPNTNLVYESLENGLEISYDYYDEEKDYTYDLSVLIDDENNTLTSPDPAFYWAYVLSTETNFARNIIYENEHVNNYLEEGTSLVYDLDMYNLDIVKYEDEVLLPYYVANQLFAGSSYYNVYYDYDGLYGIYSLPGNGTDEYDEITTSSVNNKNLNPDLVIHNFNFLAFSMDYYYGLKDFFNVDTYYDVLFKHKDGLLNVSPKIVDETIFRILAKDIDEPHTSYGYPGYYNDPEFLITSANQLSSYGTKYQKWYMDGLYATDQAIRSKWGITDSGWAANSSKRPDFWFLDNEKASAVVSLDSFSTLNIVESLTLDKSYLNEILNIEENGIPLIEHGTKYFIHNRSANDYKAVDMLIKGIDIREIDTYGGLLSRNGFIYSTFTHDYVKEINNLEVYIKIDYDYAYSATYIDIRIREIGDNQSTGSLLNANNMIKADSAIYMEFVLDILKVNAPNLKNVILDLSFNTGGNIGALYRVLGFVTNEPFMVSGISNDTKSKYTNVINIDRLNNSNDYNWALLISKTTFSAANAMATIFKDNKLGPIIGVTSGGGAASITPILLPTGTAFTTSSNNLQATRSGSGTETNPFVFTPNELGVTPTDYLHTSNLYKNAELISILNKHYN